MTCAPVATGLGMAFGLAILCIVLLMQLFRAYERARRCPRCGRVDGRQR